FLAMSSAELDAALVKLDAWESEGRWSDEPFVRDRLIRLFAEEAVEAIYAEAEAAAPLNFVEAVEVQMPSYDWSALHEEATARADKLSPEERVAEVRWLEHDQARHRNEAQFALNHATRRAEAMGLNPASDRREDLQTEESEKAAALSDEELAAAMEKIEAWEAGDKWFDAAYVRNHLIYMLIDDAAVREALASEENIQYWTLRDAEWDRYFRDAASEADLIPRAQHRDRVDKLAAAWPDLLEQSLTRQGPGVAAPAGEILTAFAGSMFGFMDLLFFALAVMSAYKIGAGSGEDE
ncbi:MAG: hypothetical protein V3T70_03015, partial [Phycisphaerae bacterium]